MESPSGECPRCDAPRVDGPECPRCGVIYARARGRLRPSTAESAIPSEPARTLAAQAPPTSAEYLELTRAVAARRASIAEARDAPVELLLRALAPPVALAAAWHLVSSEPGHAIVRTFLTMWVHEVGHAGAAWLCGYFALPGPWRTFMFDGGRSVAVIVVVAAGFASLAWRGRAQRRPLLVAAGAAGGAAQLGCVLLPADRADELITFFGDGGALVLATLLIATVYTRPGSWFRQGALRWGFLAIGAATFVDVLATWLRARSDVDAIPLGEIEGVGLSDASKLLQVHGWSAGRITGTYVALGVTCLVVILALYAVGVLRARAAVLRTRGEARPSPAAP